MNRILPTERLNMTLTELLRRQPFQWHGVKLSSPDWSHESHTLAGTVRLLGYPLLLHFIINAYWETLEFEIPAPAEARESWRRCVDTALDPPDDIRAWTDAQIVQSPTYRAEPRSVVFLLAQARGEAPRL
jgi:isoamylase